MTDFVYRNKNANRADIVLLLVNHQMFRNTGIGALANKVVIDTRGLWN